MAASPSLTSSPSPASPSTQTPPEPRQKFHFYSIDDITVDTLLHQFRPLAKNGVGRDGSRRFKCACKADYPQCKFSLHIYRTPTGNHNVVGFQHDHRVFQDQPNKLPHRVKAYILDHMDEIVNQTDLRDLYATLLTHFGPGSSQPLQHFDADPNSQWQKSFCKSVAKFRTRNKVNSLQPRALNSSLAATAMLDKLHEIVNSRQRPSDAVINGMDMQARANIAPYFYQTPTDAIVLHGQTISISLSLVFPASLYAGSVLECSIFCLDALGKNTCSIGTTRKLMGGYDDISKKHHHAITHWGAETGQQYLTMLEVCQAEAARVFHFDFARSYKQTMHDHDQASVIAFRTFAQAHGITFIEPHQAYKDEGGLKTFIDFENKCVLDAEFNVHSQDYMTLLKQRYAFHIHSIKAGVHHLDSECWIHVKRYFRDGNTAWLKWKDSTGTQCSVMKEHRLQMLVEFEKICTELPHWKQYCRAIELFVAKWESLYPVAMSQFLTTSYCAGSAARARNGFFNDNNPQESYNRWDTERVLAAARANKYPLDFCVELTANLHVYNTTPGCIPLCTLVPRCPFDTENLDVHAMQRAQTVHAAAHQLTMKIKENSKLQFKAPIFFLGSTLEAQPEHLQVIHLQLSLDEAQQLLKEAKEALHESWENAIMLANKREDIVAICDAFKTVDVKNNVVTQQQRVATYREACLKTARADKAHPNRLRLMETRTYAFASSKVRAQYFEQSLSANSGAQQLQQSFQQWRSLRDSHWEPSSSLEAYLDACTMFYELEEVPLVHGRKQTGWQCNCPNALKHIECKHSVVLGSNIDVEKHGRVYEPHCDLHDNCDMHGRRRSKRQRGIDNAHAHAMDDMVFKIMACDNNGV